MKKSLTLLLMFLLLFVAACGGSAPDKPDPTNPINPTPIPEEMTFEYELQPNATVINESQLNALISQSDNEFRFDKALLASNSISLDVGQVLLLEDVALVKITALTEEGSEVIVKTEQAALNELFDNANISIVQGLNLSASRPPTLNLAGQDVAPTFISTQGDKIAYKTNVNGFDVSLELEPDLSGKNLTLSVIVENKPGGGETAFKVSGTGKVGLEQQRLNAAIQGGESQSWDFNLDNISYEFEVAYAGVEAGFAEFELALPKAFELSIPITTPVPLGLELRFSFALLAKVQLPGNASTRVAMRYSYRGDAGFQTAGAGVNPQGATSSQSLHIDEAEAAAAAGPVGATFAVSAPRIILGSKLSENSSFKLDNIYSISSLMTGSALPGVCLGAGTQHSVTGSYELSFWGFSYKGEHDFYKKFEEKRRGNQRGCEDGDSAELLAARSLHTDTKDLAKRLALHP